MNLPDLVAAHFSRACDGALPGESVMLLSIEPEVTRFVFGSPHEPEGNVVLQLGANAVVKFALSALSEVIESGKHFTQ